MEHVYKMVVCCCCCHFLLVFPCWFSFATITITRSSLLHASCYFVFEPLIHNLYINFISVFFCAPATANLIAGRVPTCGSLQSWLLHSAAPQGNQSVSTMISYPTQSLHPDTEPTSPCPIIIMLSTWLQSDKYQLYKSLVWLDCNINEVRPQWVLESYHLLHTYKLPWHRTFSPHLGLVYRTKSK